MLVGDFSFAVVERLRVPDVDIPVLQVDVFPHQTNSFLLSQTRAEHEGDRRVRARTGGRVKQALRLLGCEGYFFFRSFAASLQC